MSSLNRYRAVWSGMPGAPGVNTFYSLAATDLTPTLRGLYFYIRTLLPSNVTVTIEPSGDIIDSATGQITGDWSYTPETPVVGDTAGLYAAPAGASLRWNTAAVVNGHRVKGRTYIVPLVGAAYDSSGSISSTALGLLQSIATSVAGTGDLHVWHRPTTVGGTDGSNHQVTSGTCKDMTVVLRSRRD